MIDNTTSRGRTVRFNFHGDFYKIIDRIGKMPLPYYIKREPTRRTRIPTRPCSPGCRRRRRTDRRPALHEAPADKLKKKGVKIVPVVLHVGLGTFRPVEVEDLTKHKMDSEYYEIPEPTACRW